MESNKVHFGLNKVHYAKITGYDPATGLPMYADPVRIPGAVNLSVDAEGENSNFYADNIVYYVLANNAGYTGDLELALVTDEFRHDILGEIYDSDGNLVENSGAPIAEFALMFEFDGDKNHIRYCFYRCTASRPGTEGATIEDEKEVNTETISLTITALDNGSVRKKTSAKTSLEAYNNWYKKVTIPSYRPEEITIFPSDRTAIKVATSNNGLTSPLAVPTPDYTTIYLNCSSPNTKIAYKLGTSRTSLNSEFEREYTGPFQISTPSSTSEIYIWAQATMTNEITGDGLKGDTKTFSFTISTDSAKENAFSEDEE